MEFGALITVFIILTLYFVPTIVAASREHHQTAAIAVLNVFLGWTVLGWVGALVWAATEVRK